MDIEVKIYKDGVKIIQGKLGFFPFENMKAFIEESVKQIKEKWVDEDTGEIKREFISDLQEVKEKVKEIEDRYEE